MKIKGMDVSATKWTENAGRAAVEYAENAIASAELWAGNTAKAADTFHQAITAPNVKERFRRGVTRAGAAKYSRKISDVGRDRFGPGVAAATDDYKLGFEPFHSTLAALTLSARKPRGDPANINRVSEGNKALNAKRLAMLGAGGG